MSLVVHLCVLDFLCSEVLEEWARLGMLLLIVSLSVWSSVSLGDFLKLPGRCMLDELVGISGAGEIHHDGMLPSEEYVPPTSG